MKIDVAALVLLVQRQVVHQIEHMAVEGHPVGTAGPRHQQRADVHLLLTFPQALVDKGVGLHLGVRHQGDALGHVQQVLQQAKTKQLRQQLQLHPGQGALALVGPDHQLQIVLVQLSLGVAHHGLGHHIGPWQALPVA